RRPGGGRRRRLSFCTGHLGALTACWVRAELGAAPDRGRARDDGDAPGSKVTPRRIARHSGAPHIRISVTLAVAVFIITVNSPLNPWPTLVAGFCPTALWVSVPTIPRGLSRVDTPTHP